MQNAQGVAKITTGVTDAEITKRLMVEVNVVELPENSSGNGQSLIAGIDAVEVTHAWRERDDLIAPSAPVLEAPSEGAVEAGTTPTRWRCWSRRVILLSYSSSRIRSSQRQRMSGVRRNPFPHACEHHCGLSLTQRFLPAELMDSPFEGVGMNSRNHIMFAGPLGWMYT